MEVNDNPWYVDTLDHFLYYVCPECPPTDPFKCQSKFDFVAHALEKHPSADGNIPVQELEEEAVAAAAAAEQPYQEQAGSEAAVGYGAVGNEGGGGGGGGQDYAAAAVAGYNNYKMNALTGTGDNVKPATAQQAAQSKQAQPVKKRKTSGSGQAGKKAGQPGGDRPPPGKKHSAPAMPMKRPKLDTSSDDGPSLAGIDFPKMEDGRYACPWPACGQILSNIGNTKRHYRQTHMEQQPQSCKVCHMELRNQAACDTHMKQTHNVTNKEIKMARFIAMSPDQLMGLYILENGKSLCTSCSVAFSSMGNGKRHFNQVHLGIKGDSGSAKPAAQGIGEGPKGGFEAGQLGQQLPAPTLNVKTEPTFVGFDTSGNGAMGSMPTSYPSTSGQTGGMQMRAVVKKPKPKPKPAGQAKGHSKGHSPGTPQKQLIKSEAMPLLVDHAMGASPIEPIAPGLMPGTGGSPFDGQDDHDVAMAHIKFSKGEDGRWPCPWPGCGQSLSAMSSVRRHYKSNHMEQLPQTCKVCHVEFGNSAACDNHMKQVHNITNKELKMAKFEAMSEDGLHGLYALENGKSLCSVCSTALSTVGSGKRHYKSVHLGIKPPQLPQGQPGADPTGQAFPGMEVFEEHAMKLEV